jgi:hypothetical protein
LFVRPYFTPSAMRVIEHASVPEPSPAAELGPIEIPPINGLILVFGLKFGMGGGPGGPVGGGGGEPPVQGNPFKMFGDRQADCVDEIMNALALLKEKLPTWYEFTLKYTKGVECTAGQMGSFAMPDNVRLNMIYGQTIFPEAMLGSSIYTDGDVVDEINIFYMAAALVHESCHIRQTREGISYSNPDD